MSWTGETAHTYARLRLEQTNPRPVDPGRWRDAVARGLIDERPATLELLEESGRSPIDAAFWLIDHHVTSVRTGSSEQHHKLSPLGDPECSDCAGTGWRPTGGRNESAPCPCRPGTTS